jgi:hypothetical protein
MESRNRTVWIVVAVVVVLFCCCALVAAAAIAGRLAFTPVAREVGILQGTIQVEQATPVRIERNFELGETPTVQIDNFAGSVIVRAGQGTTVQVVATKKGAFSANLSGIQVETIPQGNSLLIQTRKPLGLDSLSVQIEVTTPAGTQLDAHTGAGSVQVSGLQGSVKVDTGAGSVDLADVIGTINAHTGAGSVTMTNADGTIQVDTGAGSIAYAGIPSGNCSFQSGTGSITLNVPANTSASVDLGTGIGTVTVNVPVSGQVTKTEVKGSIGGGGQTTIYAHTGTGSVDLIGR